MNDRINWRIKPEQSVIIEGALLMFSTRTDDCVCADKARALASRVRALREQQARRGVARSGWFRRFLGRLFDSVPLALFAAVTLIVMMGAMGYDWPGMAGGGR